MKNAYANIILNLIKAALTASSEFDPFISKFMGMDTVKYNKYQYQSFLEVTSYFWASKGGRGILLEKIFASLGGIHSASNVTLYEIVARIMKKNNSLQTANQGMPQFLMKGGSKKLKFDLVNILNDTLIILELKNRVDSGGTAARVETLRKFFSICKSIEEREEIFTYNTRSYDFVGMLSLLGINKVEMYLGLLYNINGKEATISDDKSNGFYSSSKTQMKKYANETHLTTQVIFYEDNHLHLSFQKENLSVSINMLYGSEVIRNFTKKQLSLGMIIDKVFANSWDDIWLAFNLAISQRAMLLEYKKNQISEIKKLKENDEEFNAIYEKFCDNPFDVIILKEIVNCIQNKADFLNISGETRQENHLADCLYAFTSYAVSKSNVNRMSKRRIEEKKSNFNIFMDVNNDRLS